MENKHNHKSENKEVENINKQTKYENEDKMENKNENKFKFSPKFLFRADDDVYINLPVVNTMFVQNIKW